jgi:TolA-binding protein
MSNDQPIYNHTGEVPHHQQAPVAGPEVFLEKHFKKIVLLAIVAAAGASVAGLVKYKNALTATEAGQLVSAAKTIEDCDLVVQKYPGSTAAGNALLLKADLQWKANKKDTALGTLREFTKGFSSHPFFVSGLIGLASKLESTGEKAEAKTIYERVSSEFAKSEFAPMAQIRLGDLLWADGKDEEAKKFFESLPSKFPGELTVSMSQNRLDLIGAGLPTKEVDGPPPPPKKEEPAAPNTPPISIGGGTQPIKLESGLGASVPVTVPATPTATLTPQGTAVTNPAISVTPTAVPQKPASLPPVTPTDLKAPPAVKMVEPTAAPVAPVTQPKPPATPAVEKKEPAPSIPSAPKEVPAPKSDAAK